LYERRNIEKRSRENGDGGESERERAKLGREGKKKTQKE
jgi:hypothetical protein